MFFLMKNFIHFNKKLELLLIPHIIIVFLISFFLFILKINDFFIILGQAGNGSRPAVTFLLTLI